MRTDVTVVILAAGQGTRMRSRRAKVLHHAGGRALIEHAVDTALQVTAAENVFVVVGHQAVEVEAAVAARGVRFIQQAEQKGTAHALLCGEAVIPARTGHLVIFYGDCPLIRPETLRTLIDRQSQGAGGGTMITTLLDDPHGYGRVVRDAAGSVEAIVEQKAGTPEQLAVREINAGVYAFDAGLFWRYIHDIRPDNPAHEYYLTDIVGLLIAAGHPVGAVVAGDSAELLGINTRVELAAVDRIFRERKVRDLMLSGVTIEKPETVTIDAAVEIGIDTVIEPFAQILGATRIGENCRIGACSIVTDSELADHVIIGAFTIVATSSVGEHAHIGPYARLRLENEVAAGAHIGNFVELKKTKVGAGSKANHLAYLGDASIGEGVNIGAGAITCNYDGLRKHGTTIGNRAFIGSNSTLVAPLRIGDGAYVGAASIITETVPDDALAIGRARQENKEGWAARHRKRK